MVYLPRKTEGDGESHRNGTGQPRKPLLGDRACPQLLQRTTLVGWIEPAPLSPPSSKVLFSDSCCLHGFG